MYNFLQFFEKKVKFWAIVWHSNGNFPESQIPDIFLSTFISPLLWLLSYSRASTLGFNSSGTLAWFDLWTQTLLLETTGDTTHSAQCLSPVTEPCPLLHPVVQTVVRDWLEIKLLPVPPPALRRRPLWWCAWRRRRRRSPEWGPWAADCCYFPATVCRDTTDCLPLSGSRRAPTWLLGQVAPPWCLWRPVLVPGAPTLEQNLQPVGREIVCEWLKNYFVKKWSAISVFGLQMHYK